MPRTQNFSPVGDYAAIKRSFPNGSSFSATASPVTGKIVYLEEDWDSHSAANNHVLPGLVFGATTVTDIGKRRVVDSAYRPIGVPGLVAGD